MESGERPAARGNFGFVSIGTRIYLFGGNDLQGAVADFNTFPSLSNFDIGGVFLGYFDDLWTADLSLSAPVWTVVSSVGLSPAPRAGQGLVHMDGALYIFGGQCESGVACKVHIEHISNCSHSKCRISW